MAKEIISSLKLTLESKRVSDVSNMATLQELQLIVRQRNGNDQAICQPGDGLECNALKEVIKELQARVKDLENNFECASKPISDLQVITAKY